MDLSNKHYSHIHPPEFDDLFQISHISTPAVEFLSSVCPLITSKVLKIDVTSEM